MTDNIAIEACRIFDEAKNLRYVWENQFQQIVDYVRPNADAFTGSKTPGTERMFLTNPVDRWFEFRPTDPRQANDKQLRIWCEEASNIIYQYYSSSKSGHTQALSENFLDIGSFGTSVVHQFWKDGLKFKSFALADCWIKENADRVVDTVIRRVMMTARQIFQEFETVPSEIMKRATKPDKEFQIIHLVFPSSDKQFLSHIKPVKNFASLWVCVDTKETLRVGGYDWFPYHCPRWVKMASEVWGRSPAMKALPDIKMLNRIEQYTLKALTKATDPPLIVPSDAFLLPLKTAPGSVNYKEPGSDKVETLEISRGFPITEQKAEQKREAIRKMFYNDLIRLEKENVEMTAYEAQDRSERKLRLVAPMLGRQEAELLGPMLTLSYLLIQKHGVLRPPPVPIESMGIEYTSPAARAQTGMRAFSMDRYIQRLIPAAQLNPQVLTIVNWEAYSRKLADAMGTTPDILYSPEEVQRQQQAAAQEQQMQTALAAAEPASKAVKNLIDAGVSPNALMGQ
jgi:hypothetical protein